MGLLKSLAFWSQRRNRKSNVIRETITESFRHCRFETMEERQVLSADPLFVGGVYIEDDSGTDSQADSFYVSFEGGSDTTELTRIIIDGNQDGDASQLSAPDVYFDITPGAGRGVGGAQGFTFDAESLGLSADDILRVQVSDGGTQLVIDVQNFEAGDVLKFGIDVDQFFSGKPDDQVTSGIEFAGSSFRTFFEDPHYNFTPDSSITVGTFAYNFDFGSDDRNDTGVLTGLPTQENFEGTSGSQENRTAGVMHEFNLEPKPVTIKGTVFHDRNADLNQDAGEEGIEGATLRLQELNDDGVYVDVIRNGEVVTTQTDANGDYCFGDEGDLGPGKYRIVETQPDGYAFSTGSKPGTVAGEDSGVSETENVIAEVCIELGDTHSIDNDFGEIKAAKVSGYVYHDRNFSEDMDAGDVGIEGVELNLTGVDIFGNQVDLTGFTDADGHYCFDTLVPGTYMVTEVQPAGFEDYAETVGSVRGATIGEITRNDKFSEITVGSDDVGVEYNFGEVTYASLSGHVHLETPDGRCVTVDSPEYRAIEGAEVRLIDSEGNITTTFTDENGFYDFTGLRPGEYTVVELTPDNLLDGHDRVGTINDAVVGTLVGNDRMGQITLSSGDEAVNYDFCEVESASISGHVKLQLPDGSYVDADHPDYQGIEGVQIDLIDADGTVFTTTTDAEGYYEFTNLDPGKYAIVQHQPDGYLDGAEEAGTINGVTNGAVLANDRLGDITLGGGEQGINYDFCEIPPASVCGVVYHDRNDNGIQEAGEEGIGGVTLRLLDADGNPTGQEVLTDADGSYCFKELLPGDYKIEEVQPAGWIDGKESVGTVNGQTVGTTDQDDKLCDITLAPGENGIEYNFGEFKPASIAGYVHTDLDGNCVYDETQGEEPLSGVTMMLLNADGDVIAETLTDANGFYQFGDLLPGEYSVMQQQPDGYLSVGQKVGTVDGSGDAGSGLIDITDKITQITISSGMDLVDYNFCEVPPAKLSGFVYQDGDAIEIQEGRNLTPSEIKALRDGRLTSDDTRIEGVVLELRNGITGEVITADQVLPGFYDDGPVRTTTDANGHYCFDGLRAGNYAVFEVQPEGYIDNVDTAGTTDGVAINPTEDISPFVLSTLSDDVDPGSDAILRIAIAAGEHSELNNFSEVVVETIPVEDPPPNFPPNTPRTPNPPGRIAPSVTGWGLPGLAGAQGVSRTTNNFTGIGGLTDEVAPSPTGSYVWQLSVINDGFPRGEEIDAKDGITWQSASFLNKSSWNNTDMSAGSWLYTETDTSEINGEAKTESFTMGKDGAFPVVGDFNGDGKDEFGLFAGGEWFIDANGNRRWESDDMWAKLGDDQDHPLVGDWDGDGKDDIGVYGMHDNFDEDDLRREPGIPDSENYGRTNPKNIPPNKAERPEFNRHLQRTESGQPRTDVVDHIFRYGGEGDYPVVGDWNGDGIRTVGVFNGGTWTLDVDGNGKMSSADKSLDFGRVGDIPVVGDFDGDGVEDIGVFRDGKWIIDVDGNFELDAHDKVFELGGRGDIPVVGDFDGDGVDEAAVYQPKYQAVSARTTFN